MITEVWTFSSKGLHQGTSQTGVWTREDSHGKHFLIYLSVDIPESLFEKVILYSINFMSYVFF